MDTKDKIAIRRLTKLGFRGWESNGKGWHKSEAQGLRVVVCKGQSNYGDIFIDYVDLWDKWSRCPIQLWVDVPYGILRLMVHALLAPDGREHSLNWDGLVQENGQVKWVSEVRSGWKQAIRALADYSNQGGIK